MALELPGSCAALPVLAGFPVVVAPSSVGFGELHSNIDLFLFPPTVTMVLFLVGFSAAVNNSAHENQTAGN